MGHEDQWRRRASFRFYEELNDFLPAARRKRRFSHDFDGTPAVKDVIEALGVPHTEIDLILVDGVSVGFDHRLEGDERVAVYPMFERFDVGAVTRLRPQPLREPRFIADAQLAKLARYLRLLGFDTVHLQGSGQAEIAARAAADGRIVLTRDRRLLKRGDLTHGYWLRRSEPRQQIAEVVDALDLRARVEPFTRCMACNGRLETVAESALDAPLPPAVRGRFSELRRCSACRRVYWPGSHYRRLVELVSRLIAR